MEFMDSWYKFYWWIVDDHQLGIIGKAFNRFVRRFVKRHLDKKSKKFFMDNPVVCGINTDQERERKLICSLTSFPTRIDEIWLSIETIFRQTVKADMIVLWLSGEQFKDRQLPQSLLNCTEKGLTIRWVDEDLRSHKKYFYALQEYRDADIVLLDDDLYYPDRLLENLLSMSERHPESICATRIHKMRYATDRSLIPYRKWIHNFNPKCEKESEDYFFTSGAGTLIPAGILPKDTFNMDVFSKICFYADDVWLNFQAKSAGLKIFSNDMFDKDLISIGHSQNEKLTSTNILNGGNDKQIRAVLNYLMRNEQDKDNKF